MQIVDIAMVGQLGPAAIGAVGVGSALFFALAVFGMGLMLGLDTLVAQAFGRGQLDECRRWLLHGLLLAAILTIPLTLGARGGANHLDLLGLDPAVLELTRGYFRLVAWSILPLLLYVALRRYLQAVNFVRPVMLALVTANVINAGVNWLLVFGNAGFPELGVEGAAWATCISRTYMCAALAVAARSKVASMVGSSSHADNRFELGRLKRLVELGWPAAAQLTPRGRRVCRRICVGRSSGAAVSGGA